MWTQLVGPSTRLPFIQRSSRHFFISSRHHNKNEITNTCNRNPKQLDVCPNIPAIEEICKVEPGQVDPCQPEPSVVIIGAGMAGLSAASRLIQCGLKKVTILEATDRPGGRIHSCWLGDRVAEMGAQWIEGGCVANPVFTLAAQEGLLKAPLQRSSNEQNIFITSDGRAIDWPISLAAYHQFRQIEQQAASLFNLGAGRSHGSLHNFICVRIQQELHMFPEDQRFDAARVMYGMYNSIRCRCGDDLSQVSADQYGSYSTIPGGMVRVPLGFVGVLAPLLRVLPDHSVHYCKPVQQIRWGAATGESGMSGQGKNYCSPPRAMIKCNDGEVYKCDYVIVTMSLGVLKSKAESMFCPALPAAKSRAIEYLGYGHVDKIFMEYSRPFWVGQECKGMTFAWSQDELNDRGCWIKGISIVEEMPGSEQVICVYVSGPEAIQMEKTTDVMVVEECTKILRRFTGDPSLPFPKAILRSKWSTDRYFQGAISYMAVQSTVAHQFDLGAPTPGDCDGEAPVILFAGEATCPAHYGTVHGARLSGIREAERIIQLTKKHLGPPRPSADSPC